MRPAFDQAEIKQQLSKFINLLQTDFRQSSQATPPDNRSLHDYSLQKKLSIIFSASEPESSSLDKQNSNPSANRSFESGEKVIDSSSYQTIINSLLSTNLDCSQVKTIQKLKSHLDELKADNERLVRQMSDLKKELSSQKQANDEMLNVLIKLDEQEKELWNNYNVLSDKLKDSQEQNRVLEKEFEKARDSMLSLQNDNDFMKKLIFYANENYEALEKKCTDLAVKKQQFEMYTDRRSPKKSSMDNLLKSAKTKKNNYSPSHSELRTPSPDNFQDIYRKMIVRTLKFKGKNP